MLQPIHTIFSETPQQWDAADVRDFVQEFLRRELKTEALYCDAVRSKTAYVRAGSAALRQEVLLLEFDVIQALGKHTDFPLNRVVLSRQR